MSEKSLLSQKSLLLLFTVAPAGLGHLRVMKALYHGLPKEVDPLLLGAQDKSLSFFHRLTSIHPIFRAIFEWTQAGIPEDVFTSWYRWWLRSRSKILYNQLITVIDQRITTPDTLLIVATHFGLAHQVGSIKKKLEKEKKVKIILVVLVTDDSPQQVWYVPEADVIFVPSHTTQKELYKYGKNMSETTPQFEVCGYPISPLLSARSVSYKFNIRKQQAEPESKSIIHMAIPISGAAVGTDYFTSLIDNLHSISQRFTFHVDSKVTPYTMPFINQMLTRSFVKVRVSATDREVIDSYERLYQNNEILLEVTKPSEQAFKALLKPTDVGGSLLLFSSPVGRQEYDNLFFLRRHHLLPFQHEAKYLWEHAHKGITLNNEEGKKVLERARTWRGLELPHDPTKGAQFIWWCLKEGIFESMLNFTQYPYTEERHQLELESDGVKQFWNKVGDILQARM